MKTIPWSNSGRFDPGKSLSRTQPLPLDRVRPFFARIPDQAVLLSTTNRRAGHVQATKALDGSYLLVYIPCADQPSSLNLSSMPQGERTAWWYDPRTGIGTRIAQSFSGSKVEVTTPPYGPDWVLVVDDARSGFGPPGLDAWNS